ncbi:RNA-directed DNA polymerase, eukaryota, reverse transcriptase zinc-binding domain protein [Tanacetum coccineum]
MIASFGLSLNCKVADIIKNGEWDWPIELSQMFDALTIIPKLGLVDGMSDMIFWKSNKGRLLNFFVSSVWDDIRCGGDIVPWSNLVWFSQCIPRHSFMLWLAIIGRLNTHDNMAHWDWNENFRCIFYGKEPDSHNHLFFECEFPKSIWCTLKSMVRLDYAPNSWHDIVEYILKRPINKSIWSILQRLVLGATVYMVWQERNLRTFQNRHRSMEELYNLIKDVVRLRIMGLSLKASSQVFVAADIWKFIVNMVTGSKKVNFTPWKKQV